MAPRKPLFLSQGAGEGFAQEMSTSDSMTLGGLTMGGNIAMGTYKVTGMGDAVDPQDAVTKAQLDAVAAGIHWKHPVAVLNMIDDSDMGGSPPVGPVKGDAYVVNNWGGTYNNGDIIEWTGTAWQVIIANSGGEPPNTTWVAVSANSATTPAGSFAGKNNNTAYYNSGTNTWTFTAPTEGDAFLVNGPNSQYLNLGFTYDGANWVEFTGLASITAGAGLWKPNSTTIAVKNGDGIEVVGNSASTNVKLSTYSLGVTPYPGLQLAGTAGAKGLAFLPDPAGPLTVTAAGADVLLDGSTLSKSGTGLKVLGLPALFTIAGTAVGATVTAPNLDDLTDGSNADLLHSHAKIKKVAADIAVAEAIAKADAVYWSATNDRVGKARADNDAKSRVIGVSEVTQNTVGNPATIVAVGEILGAISTATAGTPYYLQATGGIGTALPTGNTRVILCGYAMNATDLWVHVVDYGKKLA
jgi:hypothetical protein